MGGSAVDADFACARRRLAIIHRIIANSVGMAGSPLPHLDERPLCGEQFGSQAGQNSRPVTDSATARSQRIGRLAAPSLVWHDA
jgi:hypothetical protein